MFLPNDTPGNASLPSQSRNHRINRVSQLEAEGKADQQRKADCRSDQ